MKKKFVAFGLICLLSAFSASAKLFDINEYTLSNGARLLVVENQGADRQTYGVVPGRGGR